MAAYIDLNPVRAGIVDDPMLYEWSGYGEAIGGSRRARRGLCQALSLPQDVWEGRGMARYRLFLYDEGLSVDPESTSFGKGKKKRAGFTMEARTKVVASGGKIIRGQNLRKRVASFTAGVAVGGKDFVAQIATRYRVDFKRKNIRKPRPYSSGDEGVFVMKE